MVELQTAYNKSDKTSSQSNQRLKPKWPRLYLPNYDSESLQVVRSAGLEINCTLQSNYKNILLNFWVHIYKCNHWEADGTKALVSNKDLRESNFVASVDMPWSMKSHLNTMLIRFSSFLITQKLFNSCFKKFKSLCDNLRWTSLDRNFARSDNNHLNGDDVWIMYESYEQHVDWVCSQALPVGPWHPLTCWILELESV